MVWAVVVDSHVVFVGDILFPYPYIHHSSAFVRKRTIGWGDPSRGTDTNKMNGTIYVFRGCVRDNHVTIQYNPRLAFKSKAKLLLILLFNLE